jgi:hypothetical protein
MNTPGFGNAAALAQAQHSQRFSRLAGDLNEKIQSEDRANQDQCSAEHSDTRSQLLLS